MSISLGVCNGGGLGHASAGASIWRRMEHGNASDKAKILFQGGVREGKISHDTEAHCEARSGAGIA